MNYFNNNKSQIQIGLITGVFALIASVAAPILWVGNIKETAAVQENKITTLERNYNELRGDYKTLDAKINALLLKNNINPDKIK